MKRLAVAATKSAIEKARESAIARRIARKKKLRPKPEPWSYFRIVQTAQAIAASALLSGEAQHAMLLLAAHIDGKTGYIMIGAPRLAQKGKREERAMRRRVQEAEDVGWLYVEEGAGIHGANLYVITPVEGDVLPDLPRKPGRPPGRNPLSPTTVDFQKTTVVQGRNPLSPTTVTLGSSVSLRARAPTLTPSVGEGTGRTTSLPPPSPSGESLEGDGASEPSIAPCAVTISRLKDPHSDKELQGYSWSSFFEFLTAPLPRFAGERRHKCWSPIRLAAGAPRPSCDRGSDCERHHCNENVAAVSALVIDYDNKDEKRVPIARAVEIWGDELGLFGLAHTSKSDAPDDPCWRVVLPFSRLATTAEHARIYAWARETMSRVGITIDSTCDAARHWFLPCLAKGERFEARRLNGSPLPVDDLLQRFEAERPREEPPSSATHVPSDAGAKYIEAALQGAAEDLARTGEGDRNNIAYRKARKLAGYGVDPARIERVLVEEGARRGGWNNREEHKTRKTIRNGARDGAKHRRPPPDRPAPSRRARSAAAAE